MDTSLRVIRVVRDRHAAHDVLPSLGEDAAGRLPPLRDLFFFAAEALIIPLGREAVHDCALVLRQIDLGECALVAEPGLRVIRQHCVRLVPGLVLLCSRGTWLARALDFLRI